jgi:hypothetical protein
LACLIWLRAFKYEGFKLYQTITDNNKGDIMNLGEFAGVMETLGIAYRNGDAYRGLVKQLSGKEVDGNTVSAILDPFVALVLPTVPAETKQKVSHCLEQFIPKAQKHLHANKHMHDAGDSTIVSENTADAVLVLFINSACMPLDLAMYTRDLKPVK